MLFYTPDAAQLQTQSQRNNQGRSGRRLRATCTRRPPPLARAARASTEAYEWMTGDEVARELARIDLPLSTYTQWYWKIDLHNLLHFLTLRVDPHAQWEIQEYGRVMAGMLKRVAPLSYEAWIDYDVCGGQLSAHRARDVRALSPSRATRVDGARLGRQGGARRARPVEPRDRGALRQARAAGRRARLFDRPAKDRSAEHFAARFADAVPTADKSPTD